MTGIVFATSGDAQPFLDRYTEGRLSGLEEGETAHYDDILVTVTGIGKMKATLHTERLLQAYAVDRVLHVGMCTALGDEFEVGSLVAAASVLEGDRVSLSAPSYPRMPLTTPDDLAAGTLVTHDHAISQDAENGYWQRLADLSDTTGYAVAYVAAQHGTPCLIIKAVTGRLDQEQSDFQNRLTTARSQLADFVLRTVNGSQATGD